MSFQRAAHWYNCKDIVWFTGRPGERWRVKLKLPAKRNKKGWFLFELLEGPKKGEILAIPQEKVTEAKNFGLAKGWEFGS